MLGTWLLLCSSFLSPAGQWTVESARFSESTSLSAASNSLAPALFWELDRACFCFPSCSLLLYMCIVHCALFRQVNTSLLLTLSGLCNRDPFTSDRICAVVLQCQCSSSRILYHNSSVLRSMRCLFITSLHLEEGERSASPKADHRLTYRCLAASCSL